MLYMSETFQLDFKDSVHEWIRLSNEIQQLQAAIRAKKQKMNHLGGFIMEYMHSNDKDTCNVGESSAIVVKQRKSTQTLKKTDILNYIKKLTNEEKAVDIVNDMFDSRKVKVKNVLKLTDI